MPYLSNPKRSKMEGKLALVFLVWQTCVLLINAKEETCTNTQSNRGSCSAPIDTILTWQQIIQKEQKYANRLVKEGGEKFPQQKNFDGETLAYVTPWNNHGYDVAKWFKHKFTYISPVWFQIRQNAKTNKPQITGAHDIDRRWLVKISKVSQIVPRFVFEMNSLTPAESTRIIELISKQVQTGKFHGIVLEIPVIQQTIHFIHNLAVRLKSERKIIILVLSANLRNEKVQVSPDLFRKLCTEVHRFSVNAYDYSAGQIGPNSPSLPVKNMIENLLDGQTSLSNKLLLGIPFYGYDSGEAIVGKKYVEILKSKQPNILWNKQAEECYLKYDGENGLERVIYYPCLRFIHNRLQLANSLGVGIAIWEIGQGLDYFYDLV